MNSNMKDSDRDRHPYTMNRGVSIRLSSRLGIDPRIAGDHEARGMALRNAPKAKLKPKRYNKCRNKEPGLGRWKAAGLFDASRPF